MMSTCRHHGQHTATLAPAPAADIKADGLAEFAAVAHCIQHGLADERRREKPDEYAGGGSGSGDTGTANQIALDNQDPQNAIQRTESAQSAAGTPRAALGENQKREAAALRKVQQSKPASRKVQSSVRCGVSISSGSLFYANVVAKLHRENVQKVQAESR
jgi:hypothetical protein